MDTPYKLKNKIVRHLDYLCQNTRQLTKLTKILVAKNILTQYEVETIGSKSTDYEKNLTLFNLAITKGENALKRFLTTLESSGNGLVARKIVLTSASSSSENDSDEEQALANTKTWFDVMPPVSNFAGRMEELEELAQCSKIIYSGTTDSTKIASNYTFVVISGMGGVGKSELLRRFAREEFQLDGSGHCIWINAESETTAFTSYQRLADELQIPLLDSDGRTKDLGSLVGHVLRYFHTEKYLTVLDNVEEYDGPIGIYYNTLQGQRPGFKMPLVIATTRDKDTLSGLSKLIDLNVFTPQVSREFIQKSLPNSTIKDGDDAVDQLGLLLGYFPLALQQAVAYIRQEIDDNPEFSIGDFLTLFEMEKTKLLDFSSNTYVRSNTYALTTYATWRITIARIETHPHGRNALDILNRIAYFSSDRIPTSVIFKYYEKLLDPIWFANVASEPSLQAYAEIQAVGKCASRMILSGAQGSVLDESTQSLLQLKKSVFAKSKEDILFRRHLVSYQPKTEDIPYALSVLKRYSMVKLNSGIMSIHRLVQDVTRLDNRSSSPPTEKQLLKEILKCFQVQYWQFLSEKTEKTIEFVDHAIQAWGHALLSHAANRLLTKFPSFPSCTCFTLERLSRYDESIQFANNSIKALETNPDEKVQKELVDLEFQLFKALHRKERQLDCANLYASLYPKCIEQHGADHKLTLSLQKQMGNILCELTRFDDSIELLEEVLIHEERIYGPEHAETFRTKCQLVATYITKRDIIRAAAMVDEMYTVAMQVLDEEEILKLQMNKAMILEAQLNLVDAVSMYQLILEKQDKLLGAAHPDTLKMAVNMASLLRQQGKHMEALEIMTSKTALLKEVLGPTSLTSLTARSNLAVTLSEMGKFAAAIDLCREVIELVEQQYGRHHRLVLIAQNQLGLSLLSQGSIEEAVIVLRETNTAHKHVYGETNPQTSLTQMNLGSAICKIHPEEGLQILRDALQQLYESGAETVNVYPILKCKLNIAYMLSEQGKHEEADAIRDEILKVQKTTLGPNHPDTLETMNNVACSKLLTQKFAEAEEILGQIVVIELDNLGEEHPITLACQHNLAYASKERGKYKKSIEMNRHVLEFRNKVLGPTHMDTLATKSNLAQVLYVHDPRLYKEAQELWFEVYDIYEAKLGPNHEDTKNIRNFLETVEEEIGNPDSPDSMEQLIYARGAEIQNRVCNNIEEEQKLRRDKQNWSELMLGDSAPRTIMVEEVTNAVECAEIALFKGDSENNEKILADGIGLLEKYLGADNPEVCRMKAGMTLTNRQGEAISAFQNGFYMDSYNIGHPLVENFSNFFGTTDTRTIATMNVLGVTMMRLEKFKEAEDLHRIILQERLRSLAQEDELVLLSRYNIALALFGQGRLEESRSDLQFIFEVEERTLGKNHDNTLYTASQMAVVLERQDRQDEAFELIQRVVSWLLKGDRDYDNENKQHLLVMHRFGTILSGLGKFEEAKDVLQKIVQEREHLLPVDHPDTLESKCCLAEAMDNMGDFKESFKLLKEVLPKLVERLGMSHSRVEETKSRIMKVLQSVLNSMSNSRI